MLSLFAIGSDPPSSAAWSADGYRGGSHSFSTLVLDRSTSCGNWARTNECDGSNGAHVRRMCPLSCNRALSGQRDVSPHCGAWSLGGQCSKNEEYMRVTCPVSCGWTVGLCRDFSSACPRLARRGMCADVATLTLCGESCGICRSSCRDTSTSCPGWIIDEWHFDNPATVLPACSYSSGICHDAKEVAEPVGESVDDEPDEEEMRLAHELMTNSSATSSVSATEKRVVDEHFPVCEDANETLCAIWTRSACAMNPSAVVRLCPRMCGACDVICADHVHSCHDFAENGQLSENLYRVCAATAGICSKIESFVHFSSVDSNKDEL